MLHESLNFDSCNTFCVRVGGWWMLVDVYVWRVQRAFIKFNWYEKVWHDKKFLIISPNMKNCTGWPKFKIQASSCGKTPCVFVHVRVPLCVCVYDWMCVCATRFYMWIQGKNIHDWSYSEKDKCLHETILTMHRSLASCTQAERKMLWTGCRDSKQKRRPSLVCWLRRRQCDRVAGLPVANEHK